MTVEKLNDAPAVAQTLEHAAKFLTLVVWKLAPKGVRITAADIEKFAKEDVVLVTLGQSDAFTFSITDRAGAARLAAHNKATNEGRG